MKNFYMFLLAAAAVLPASAAYSGELQSRRSGSETAAFERAQCPAYALENTACTASRSEEVIVTPPAGETKVYGRDASAYFYFLGTVGRATDNGYREEIVFCENGEVYLRNPVSGLSVGS